jgi:hypothetical protein
MLLRLKPNVRLKYSLQYKVITINQMYMLNDQFKPNLANANRCYIYETKKNYSYC